ncbi:peroxisome assembly factor 2 isoform X4 [Simochromis diagramma]|uniref:peroxisome assembly factor 2 isoform X4 n=1 Tax=Simochromis diagramma TaxID=43689 RepID=UPI001A7EBCCC|nr:peroxisome assembly factor 2 isoform X4 [Simochromis diagramma]
MAVQVELSYLETFPSHLSPLDVLMLKPHLDRVFLNDTDPPTVLFTPQGPQSSGRTGILLRVHQTTEEETADGVTCPTANTESAPRVRLFASRLFLRHHGLQQFRGTGTVRAVEPVSLDRVVVGARSRQSLRLAGSEQFTDRLLELCRPGHWLLARQGDPLLLPRHTILGEDPGQRWDPPPPQPSGCRSDTFCRSASPPYASELHIQLVTSPSYNNLGCYDNLLAQHFCTPRLVSPGDVLTVPAGNHPDLLETPSEGIHRCPVLFFRVQKVCSSAGREEGGGAYLASRQRTSLYMGTSINSPVPCSLVEGAALSPPGLNKTVELLIDTILPHLQHSSSLSGCTVLLHGAAGSGKMAAVRAASGRLNLHLLKVDCVSLCADSPAASEVKLVSVFQRAEALQPCVLLLRNLQLVLRSRGAAESDCRVQAKLCQLLSCAPTSVVMVATVCKVRDLPAGIMAAFVHQVAIESPTEEQRRAMLSSLSRDLHLGKDVNLENLSRLTTGFVLGDLSALLVEAGRAAYRRLIHSCGARQQEDLCSSGVTILNQDFTSALEILQDTLSKAIGAPKIPNVRWEDVGGLQHVKKEILDTVQLPLQCPQLLSLDLNRTGILLCGPPGTGKTLLAKAVATECSMTFLSVKGPELINMYVGQSEENIREVFHRARSAAPCVIFFDELDSLAPSRGRSGDSGGVMDRVVSQLLAELDALHSSGGVFVIGATNRPDLLDQSLLRPGRFDKLVYMGINEDRVSQLQVFQAILRKFQLDPAVNLQEVVDCCPAHMTGADLYALCSDATMAAIKRKISLISDGLDSEDSPVLLSTEDFSTALENFKSSVSDEELLRYKDIQQKLAAK